MRAWGLVFVVVFFSFSAQADDRFYIAPSLSYIVADSERGVDNAVGMTFSLGKSLSDTLGFEFSMSGTTFSRGDKTLQQGGMMIDAFYYFQRDEAGSRSFYMVFGGGILRNQEGSSRTTNTMFDLGLGGLYSLNAKIKLRADFRYRLESAASGINPTDKDDFVFNVGLVVPVGVKEN